MKNKLIYIKTLMLSIMMNGITAFADDPDGSAAANDLKELLDVFLGYISKAGFVLIAYGLGKMIFAFKNDNAESKAKGSMILLGGVFLVTIDVILTNMGAFDGITK